MYEAIIIIPNIINTTDIIVFLGINVVNTTFPLNNYYLYNLIEFLISISSIKNRTTYKRQSYTFTTIGHFYIIRLNFDISTTIRTDDKNDYNLIYYNYYLLQKDQRGYINAKRFKSLSTSNKSVLEKTKPNLFTYIDSILLLTVTTNIYE